MHKLQTELCAFETRSVTNFGTWCTTTTILLLEITIVLSYIKLSHLMIQIADDN